ncbi:MAG TPA: hypothetical protein OIM29_06235 [Oscillospiraceae bacterium]|nr:hypothetical protein [Oscillospiraceae bacterium]
MTGKADFENIKIASGISGEIKLEDAKFSAVKDVKLNQRLKKVYYSLQDIYPQINIGA